MSNDSFAFTLGSGIEFSHFAIMPKIADLSDTVPHYLPLLITLAIVAAIVGGANWLFVQRTRKVGTRSSFGKPIVMLILTALALVAIIIALPVRDAVKDQLLGLLGLVLTGMIALSSTTFVSNAMAGFMVRSIGAFRSGDFIRVGTNFGRVSARGLFHTEIQTEDRDLTTLPNLYLVTNPVSVVRASGTIVSATVSLGYDTHQAVIEPLLLEAAKSTELEEPFVQVLELGDFSVNYRIAGILREVKQLVSKRSSLRINVMNTLHDAGIEILSPTAMMQRPLKDGQRILPAQTAGNQNASVAETTPEDHIFDKADEAEELEKVIFERERMTKELSEIRSQAKGLKDEELNTLNRQIESRESDLARLIAHHEALIGAKEKA